MKAEEKRIADVIRSAFRGVSLGGGVGLMQGQGLDDYADAETIAEYRANDQKDDWTLLDPDRLNSCHSSLSFFDAEGMRFHLPAYLIADLEGTLNQDIIFHLTYRADDAMSRFILLNPQQRNAVREFLLFRLADSDFEREMIDAALATYWRSL